MLVIVVSSVKWNNVVSLPSSPILVSPGDIVGTIATQFSGVALLTIPYSIYIAAPFANILVFFFLTRAMCVCYNDWTSKMLDATAKPMLKSYQVNNHSILRPEP